ncbi:MAG: hypothetical protein IH898_06345 [Planctomycetes bacterium]|nr:hypothetical protein [Planctomycetota bacterium]
MSSKFSNALILSLSLSLALLLSTSFGCQRREGVSTYTTKQESASRSPTDFPALARQLDHTLAAILPQGDQAWFFKMAGPAPAVERRRADFLAFLKTVAPAATAGAPPTWQLPEGWEEKGASQMRVATLVVPDDDGPLEIAVSSLPLTDDWDDFLERNVNRWLGQLGQGPLAGATIKKLIDEVATAAGPATVIELVGVRKDSSRGNPHAGMTATRLPRTSPPPSQQSASQQSVDAPLAFDTPAAWQPGRMSMMRKAAFNVVDGDQQAEVTVIDFSVDGGPRITDVAANVQRWAREVGLTGLDDTALEKLVQETKIDGIAGSYVALLGPEDAERPVGMLAAMVVRDERVWFFKLSGDRSLVEKQQDAFQSFLHSVRFQ